MRSDLKGPTRDPHFGFLAYNCQWSRPDALPLVPTHSDNDTMPHGAQGNDAEQQRPAVQGGNVISACRYKSQANVTVVSDSSQQRTANIWSIYVKEAKSSDNALLETWKGDMESVIIFVRLHFFWV